MHKEVFKAAVGAGAVWPDQRQKGRKNPKEQKVQKLHLSAEVLNSEWEEKVGKHKVQKQVRLRIQAQVPAIEFS